MSVLKPPRRPNPAKQLPKKRHLFPIRSENLKVSASCLESKVKNSLHNAGIGVVPANAGSQEMTTDIYFFTPCPFPPSMPWIDLPNGNAFNCRDFTATGCDHMLYGKSSIDKFFWMNFFAGQAMETFEVPSSVLTAWLECLVPDLTCSLCCVRRHRVHPFHQIERWDGHKFLTISLKSLGLKLQLNHAGSFCENPIPAHTNMLVLHTNGINLPEDWVNVPEKLKSGPWSWLGIPGATSSLESYVLSRASDEDISTCVGFQALAKANSKFSVGLRYTGVVLCYTNMDYIFGSVLQYVLILLVLISYDIACQWFTNLFSRIDNHWPDSIKPRPNTTLVPAIPKLHEPMHEQKDHQVYSLNLIKGIGFSDCECPERVWAPHNALSNSTKTQGPGSRQDVLDDHFGFWNWLKYIGLGSTLLQWYKAAVAQHNLQQEGHCGLTASLDPDLVQKWETMCQDWEADSFPKKAVNPYHLDDAYMSKAQIKKELAEEEERRIAEGGVSLHETLAAGFIQMGLDLEEAQCCLKRLNVTIASKISTTLGDEQSITEEHNSLHVWLRAWEKLLPIYIPGLLQYETNLSHSSATSQKGEKGSDKPQDTPEGSSSNKPEDAVLWLPSRIPALIHSQKSKSSSEVPNAWTHYKSSTESSKSKDGMRSRSVIGRVHLKARNAADCYRASRAAKLELAGPGKWEETFRPLNDSDIRGYQDPNHLHPKAGRPGTLEDNHVAGPSTAPNTGDNQEFKLFNEVRTRRDGTGETRRTLSWIWLTIPSNDSEEDKDDILRVEWAKSQARAARATEEVMLLKEEMRRVLAFLEWKSHWWQDRQCTWTGLEKSMAEGVQAFTLRQSSLQSQLAAHFHKLWKAPLEDSEKEASNDSHTTPASQKDTGDDNDDNDDDDDDDADEQLEGGLDNDWDDNILEEEED
ncbi:hypothetical protein CPB84DRAFT_1750196 [Gymnopilus junonius]|uniref:CxC2-like cysteine cluster KDZ transposase-associated domain-containing protein n=1 Tax=Gymnopilus junonius TaxID=109634 RepID=A0A9P5TK00_GYMJU|nr:hypothetical protein CPB84DRAFT_1750196 [Gymnopilus junonius]